MLFDLNIECLFFLVSVKTPGFMINEGPKYNITYNYITNLTHKCLLFLVFT